MKKIKSSTRRKKLWDLLKMIQQKKRENFNEIKLKEEDEIAYLIEEMKI